MKNQKPTMTLSGRPAAPAKDTTTFGLPSGVVFRVVKNDRSPIPGRILMWFGEMAVRSQAVRAAPSRRKGVWR